MKKLFAAVALTIALPAAAFAQNAPAAGKMSCCDKKDMADCHGDSRPDCPILDELDSAGNCGQPLEPVGSAPVEAAGR
jgi:hypothetical protein